MVFLAVRVQLVRGVFELIVPVAVPVPAIWIDTRVHDNHRVFQIGAFVGQQFINGLHGSFGAYTLVAVYVVA